jgi:hypothetical protein
MLEVRRQDSDWTLELDVRATLALQLAADLDLGSSSNPAAVVRELRMILDDLRPRADNDAFRLLASRLSATMGDQP